MLKYSKSDPKAKYKFTQRIGQGGYGKIYESYDNKNHRKVAIKTSKMNGNNGLEIAKVFRELTILKIIRVNNKKINSKNSNLIDIYDYSIFINELNEIHLYVVMPLCSGDLNTWIKTHPITGPRDINKRYKIFADIVNGVHQLHQLKIVHRDLTPKNVLISDDGTQVKITDFGLSRYFSSKLISHSYGSNSAIMYQLGEEVCALIYKPPELLFFKGIPSLNGMFMNDKIDIWCLGLIFFELITGKPLIAFASWACEGVPRRSPDDYFYFVQTCQMSFSKLIQKVILVECPLVNTKALNLILELVNLNPFKRPSAKRIIGNKFVRMKRNYKTFIDYKAINFEKLDSLFQFEELDFENQINSLFQLLVEEFLDENELEDSTIFAEYARERFQINPLVENPLVSRSPFGVVPKSTPISYYHKDQNSYRAYNRPQNSIPPPRRVKKHNDECVIC